MRAFRTSGAGVLSAEFEPVEAALLTQLASQVAGILAGEGTDPTAPPDPAIARMLPDAYPGDPEASAEFRRFTASDLTERKVRNAQAIIADVAEALVAEGSTEVLLDAQATQAWLGAGFARESVGGLSVDGIDPATIDAEEFERLVVDELDELPDDMVDGLENLVFVTEDRPEDGSLDLLGLYDGVALTERGSYGFGELPDRIILYREPLLAACDDVSELKDQIHVTLVHEIAHFYGLDDEQLHELGWS